MTETPSEGMLEKGELKTRERPFRACVRSNGELLRGSIPMP
jgi:hypothetical protein